MPPLRVALTGCGRIASAAIVVATVILLIVPRHAAAYLDPGTGSMVLQIAIGGVLAVVTALKLYWGRMKCLFQRRFRKVDS
jgi:hypothetical protein